MPPLVTAVAAAAPTVIPSPPRNVCVACGVAQGGMRTCSACFAAHYCGQQCSTAHWPQHRRQCPLLGLRAAPAALLRQLDPSVQLLQGDGLPGGDGVAVISFTAMPNPLVLLTANQLAALRAALLELPRHGQPPKPWQLIGAVQVIDWARLTDVPTIGAIVLLAEAQQQPEPVVVG